MVFLKNDTRKIRCFEGFLGNFLGFVWPQKLNLGSTYINRTSLGLPQSQINFDPGLKLKALWKNVRRFWKRFSGHTPDPRTLPGLQTNHFKLQTTPNISKKASEKLKVAKQGIREFLGSPWRFSVVFASAWKSLKEIRCPWKLMAFLEGLSRKIPWGSTRVYIFITLLLVASRCHVERRPIGARVAEIALNCTTPELDNLRKIRQPQNRQSRWIQK